MTKNMFAQFKILLFTKYFTKLLSIKTDYAIRVTKNKWHGQN